MAKKEIRVAIIKTDSESIEVVDNFEHSLESMQGVVGGYIEALTIREKDNRAITVWLNEEGKINQLPSNFPLVAKSSQQVLDIVMGDVLITSSDEEGDTVGLNDDELEYIHKVFDFTRGIASDKYPCKKILELEHV